MHWCMGPVHSIMFVLGTSKGGINTGNFNMYEVPIRWIKLSIQWSLCLKTIQWPMEMLSYISGGHKTNVQQHSKMLFGAKVSGLINSVVLKLRVVK